MKRIFLIAIVLTTMWLNLSAKKSVSSSHKILSNEGCSVAYSIIHQDSTYFIYVTITSERLVFSPKPSMKVKTFDNTMLDIMGTNVFQNTITDGIGVSVPIGNTVVTSVYPYSETSSIACFEVTEEQFERLSIGVKKIRLSTIPIIHEKEFKRDRIGAKLYQLYLEQRHTNDEF